MADSSAHETDRERGAAHRVEEVEQHVGVLGFHPVERLQDEDKDRVWHPGLAQAPDDAPEAASASARAHVEEATSTAAVAAPTPRPYRPPPIRWR